MTNQNTNLKLIIETVTNQNTNLHLIFETVNHPGGTSNLFPGLTVLMPKKCCESKNHFARCVTQVEGRPDKITWKCDHCNKHVIAGQFKAAYERVHLAALEGNGLCSNLCNADDDHAEGRRQQFRKLIKDLQKLKEN